MGTVAKTRIGLVGCGVISDIYLQTLAKFDALEVVACASLDINESQAKAQQYNIPTFCTVDELMSNREIDIVLNLTVPAAHAQISLSALATGKHVYSEKPLAINFSEAKEVIRVAKNKGLCVGNAPDTFLGGRIQTLKKALEAGLIGEPIGVSAFACHHGVERHHPNPDFYYKVGGGPLFDLGPYYLNAMIALLGPVKRTSGLSKKSFQHRIIESQPRKNEYIDVEVDTHVCANLEFTSGVIGTMVMSFDVWDSQLPRLEIYGTKGTLCIADPDPVDGANIFGGEVLYKTRESARWTYRPRVAGLEQWEVVDNSHGFNEDSRGLGLVDMVYAIEHQRPLRASGELALHVCEIMEAILSSSALGQYAALQTTCDKPAPLPENFPLSEATIKL